MNPQLNNPDFRFILNKKDDKIPLENYWQCSTLKEAQEKWEAEKTEALVNNRSFTKDRPERLTQYRFDDPILTDHKEKGGNIGIVCGIGGVVVVDVDKPMEDVEMIKTMTVETPSGGKHYYYTTSGLKKKIILEKDGIHYGEIQAGSNTQIICPGCKAKSKLGTGLQEYRVVEDSPITEVTYEQLKDLLGLYFKERRSDKEKFRQMYVDDKFSLPIDRVISLSKFRQRGSEYHGSHPVHGSTGGMNFSVNPSKNVWHCFRHDVGGGVLELIGQMEGVISCGESIKGDKFNLVKKLAQEKYGMVVNKPATPTDLKLSVIQFLAQGKNDEATEVMVKDILSRNHIYTVRDDKAPEIWMYREGVYIPHGKTYILEECRNILENAYNVNLANLVVNKIMTDTFVEAEKFFQTFNGDWVAVKNGLLNPITKEIRDFTPEEIHFTKLPVEYRPDMDCPNIKKHFKDVTNDESDIRVLEEISGWFLLNEYKPERAIMLSGTGRNGKGKTIMLWKEFLGSENISTISLQQFEQDQYAAGDLLNKRANLAGDIDSATIKNSALLKQITGRDPISSNRKYLSRIKFCNNAKIVCAANEIPRTRDINLGFFSRWVLVDFPFRFLSEQEMKATAEEEKEFTKLADLEIINKLTTPEELSGLLNLAIEGVHRLLKSGDFSTSRTVEQVKLEWEKRSDSFSFFVKEFMVEEYESHIPKQEVRHYYSLFCQKFKLRAATDKIIKDRMSELLGAYETRKSLDGDERARVWEGVGWLPDKARTGVSKVSGVLLKVVPRARVDFSEVGGQVGQVGTEPNPLYAKEVPETLSKTKHLRERITDFLRENGGMSQEELAIGLGEKIEDVIDMLKEMRQKGYVYEATFGVWQAGY